MKAFRAQNGCDHHHRKSKFSEPLRYLQGTLLRRGVELCQTAPPETSPEYRRQVLLRLNRKIPPIVQLAPTLVIWAVPQSGVASAPAFRHPRCGQHREVPCEESAAISCSVLSGSPCLRCSQRVRMPRFLRPPSSKNLRTTSPPRNDTFAPHPISFRARCRPRPLHARIWTQPAPGFRAECC